MTTAMSMPTVAMPMTTAMTAVSMATMMMRVVMVVLRIAAMVMASVVVATLMMAIAMPATHACPPRREQTAIRVRISRRHRQQPHRRQSDRSTTTNAHDIVSLVSKSTITIVGVCSRADKTTKVFEGVCYRRLIVESPRKASVAADTG